MSEAKEVKVYKFGKNTIRVHGQIEKTPQLEKAVQRFMREVFAARAIMKGEQAG